MKDLLIEIKNNLQGNESRADEAENQINDLEHKEAKRTNQKKKKKNPIEQGQCKQPLGQLQEVRHLQKEKRKSKILEIYLKKIVKENSLIW